MDNKEKLSGLLKKNDGSAPVLMEIAECYLAEKDFGKAEEFYKLAADKGHPVAAAKLSQLTASPDYKAWKSKSADTPKKSGKKTGIIIGVIIAAVLVIGGAVGAVIAINANKPKEEVPAPVSAVAETPAAQEEAPATDAPTTAAPTTVAPTTVPADKFEGVTFNDSFTMYNENLRREIKSNYRRYCEMIFDIEYYGGSEEDLKLAQPETVEVLRYTILNESYLNGVSDDADDSYQKEYVYVVDKISASVSGDSADNYKISEGYTYMAHRVDYSIVNGNFTIPSNKALTWETRDKDKVFEANSLEKLYDAINEVHSSTVYKRTEIPVNSSADEATSATETVGEATEATGATE